MNTRKTSLKKTATAAKKKVKKSDRKTLVLLDAHAILHRAYHALPDFTSPTGDPTGALYGVVTMLLKIIEDLSPQYIAACYDLPGPTYRHEVYEAYKAGRKKLDESLVKQINRSRDIFESFGIRIYEYPGFEADDMLGTIVEQTKKMDTIEVIIASGDMDTLQLIDKDRVKVYTLKKGIRDTILYNEKAVVDRFGFGPERIIDYKGLRGDPSDNIPGIKGIGDKSATELIIKFGGVEEIYKKLKKNESVFVEKGIKQRIITLLKDNEEEAQFSRMLATIRRDAPIKFELPLETWRERLDTEKVYELFNELGFRTLTARVSMFFGGGLSQESSPEETVDAKRLAHASVALWLVSSDTTNPTYEDILQFGRGCGANTFDDAERCIMNALKERGLERVWNEIEVPLMEVLRSMERNGIAIDVPYLKSLSVKMHAELSTLESIIHEAAGRAFNINSPKQLGDILYDTLALKPKNQKKTASGQRSTRESELEKLIGVHPIIKEVLRYRELQKLVGTYIDTIPALVREDGRIHTTFLQAGASTGRMATQNPSIQNIPARTPEGRAIRRAFIAPPHWKLVSIDYSQIELRIAAFLSKDPNLMDIFKRGEDVHRGVASRVFGVSESEVTTEMRRRAKIINFGILYGMGVTALRQNLGGETTRGEAQEFLNAYFNTFTKLAQYLETTKEFARVNGYTETYFGRRRYFPGMNSSIQFIRAQAERMAINAPIQGTSADITRLAMVEIHRFLKKENDEAKARMLLQVHDELVFEIEGDAISRYVPQLKRIMEEVLTPSETEGIPLLVEAKVGENWEEMEHYL